MSGANVCFIHIHKRSAEGRASAKKIQMSFHSFRKHLDTMSPHLQTVNKKPNSLPGWPHPRYLTSERERKHADLISPTRVFKVSWKCQQNHQRGRLLHKALIKGILNILRLLYCSLTGKTSTSAPHYWFYGSFISGDRPKNGQRQVTFPPFS